MPHALITADSVGGVWTYTRALAMSLCRRNWRVTVAVFGPPPSPEAAAWAEEPGIELLDGGRGLEWMPGAEAEVREGWRWLQARLRWLRPDVLHANQFSAAAAAAGAGVPVLLTAHSDLVSWWRAVHGCWPPALDRFYGQAVLAGLAAADVVVAPTRVALHDVRDSYGAGAWFTRSQVIPNGEAAAGWGPPSESKNRGYAAAAGRIWDAGKQISLLLQPGLALPIRIAGAWREPGAASGPPFPRAGDGMLLPQGVQWAGELSRAGMKALLAGADVFIVPSRYEPFGLSALEAALSGCALLLNEIPSLREVWGGAAAYFRRDDPAALATVLRAMTTEPGWRRGLARAARRRAIACYGADLMAERYLSAYERAMARPSRIPFPGGRIPAAV